MSVVDGGRARELSYRAARVLATGTGSLSERLRDAWLDHLILLRLPSVPWPDLAEEYRDIADYLASDPKQGGLIIERPPEHDQRRIAADIFEFFVKVQERTE